MLFDQKTTREKLSLKIDSKISTLLRWQSRPQSKPLRDNIGNLFNTGNLFAKNLPLTQNKSQSNKLPNTPLPPPPPLLTKQDPLTYLHFAIYTNLFPLSNVASVASIGFGVKTNGNTPKDIRFFVLPRLHFMLSKMTPLPFTNHFVESKHQLLQTAIVHYIAYFQDSKTNQALLSKAISLQKTYLQERKLLNDFFFSENSSFNLSLKAEKEREKASEEQSKNEIEEKEEKEKKKRE